MPAVNVGQTKNDLVLEDLEQHNETEAKKQMKEETLAQNKEKQQMPKQVSMES